MPLLIMKVQIIIFMFLLFIFKNILYSNTEKDNVNLIFPIQKDIASIIPIYTQNDIKRLKQPMSPIYIHYMDWEGYSNNNKILRKGILFTYRNLMLKEVYISGNFTNWRKIKMHRNPNGIFYWIQPIIIHEENYLNEYLYKFYVNGIWENDHVNPNKKIYRDNVFSFYVFDDPENHYLDSFRIIKTENLLDKTKLYLVEFRIHEYQIKRVLNKKEINSVSIVGDFNYWDSTNNILLKDEKGVYIFKTYLTQGIHYYKYIVDGEWIIDPLNENTKYLENFKNLFNYIILE